MEKAKTIDFSNRPKDTKNDTLIPGCPLWLFGDKTSADMDMKERFNIIEYEKKD